MAEQKPHFVVVAITVLLALHVFSNVVQHAHAQVPVSAMMDLFRNWNQSTEDVQRSLPGVERRTIHRDIKANNVLLDRNLHPKIADFGLAMLFPDEDTHVTIVQIAGTKGYLAPEYASRGQVSDKVDVFSFGVLALEVVSGRKNISFDVPADKTYLIDWAWKLNEEGRLRELVDRSLAIQFDEEVVVQRVLGTALACVQTAAARRPSMDRVVGMLQGNIEITESVRDGVDENVNHRALLGLSSSATTLMPGNEESRPLHLGENSSSGSRNKSLELSSIREMAFPR